MAARLQERGATIRRQRPGAQVETNAQKTDPRKIAPRSKRKRSTRDAGGQKKSITRARASRTRALPGSSSWPPESEARSTERVIDAEQRRTQERMDRSSGTKPNRLATERAAREKAEAFRAEEGSRSSPALPK